ncbi:MAG TPA: hypothetical protein VFU02_13945 [Polyangiaceae bacterium]|nr:hypothetical protein [Polyangiaceae bacterium]
MAKNQRATASDVLRVSGALAATLPVAVLGSVCVARCLPGDVEFRFTMGLLLAIPLWLLLMCNAFLARGGGRVWFWCSAASVVFGLLTYAVP